jgi:hypothetical protein
VGRAGVLSFFARMEPRYGRQESMGIRIMNALQILRGVFAFSAMWSLTFLPSALCAAQKASTMSDSNSHFSLATFRRGLPAWLAAALAIGVSLLCIPRVWAQQFFAAPEYPTGNHPQSVATGDFNGDGKPDLVTADTLGNAVSILLNNGDGTFHRHVDYATGAKPEVVAVADFNGDLKPDLIVTNYDSMTFSVLLGRGDGTFQTHVDYPTGVHSISVAVGDFNNDGLLDLAMSNTGDRTISILLGNGDGTFQSGVKYQVPAFAGSVVVGDFNGDKKSDLAVVVSEIKQNFAICDISVLLGNGDGTFQAHVDSPTNCGGGIAQGDFNRDGKEDLAIANNSFLSSGVGVLLGNGDGSFQVEVDYATDLFPSSVNVVDLNRDGKADLALSLPDGNSASVLLGNGNGTFGAHREFGTGRGAVFLVEGDFNSDGEVDLATANAYGDTVSLLFGVGDGTLFPARQDFGVYTIPQGIASGDVNRDGILDLVVADGSTEGFVSVLLGHGDGTFSAHVDYPAGSNPDSVVVADFNGDFKPDLVLANGGTFGVSVLLGNGDGTFQPEVECPVSATSTGIATGDFNGDGKLDLAVALGSVAVLLGNGDGTFQPELDYATGGPATSIVVADLNHDGKLDIAVTIYTVIDGTPVVSVFLGNGDGTFQPYTNFTLAAQGYAIEVGDVNGDGKQDMVVAVAKSNDEGWISILLGNGDGTFQAHKDYATASLASSVAIGDFTGDGILDVAATNWNSSGVGVFAGMGDGTFSSRVDYTVGGYYPTAVIAADFNQDRKPDLAVGGVTVLLNASPVPWFALSITTAGSGSGTVTTNPGGFCGRHCSKNFAAGTSLILTATGKFGSGFAGWSGAGCSGTSACSVTMNSDQAVAATFNLVAEFSISTSAAAPNPVSPGQSSTSSVGIGAINGFSSSVSLTCSVQPMPELAPQCSVNPNSLTPGTPATLTITTSPPPAAKTVASSSFAPFAGWWLPITGLALVGIGFGERRETKARMLVVLLPALLVAIIAIQTACGGSSGTNRGGGDGTPPGTYTITVTGTSVSLTHSSQVKLKVQ